jgi:hypothetical protein
VYTAQRGEKNKRRLAENNEIKKMLSKQPCEWEEIVWVKQKVQMRARGLFFFHIIRNETARFNFRRLFASVVPQSVLFVFSSPFYAVNGEGSATAAGALLPAAPRMGDCGRDALPGCVASWNGDVVEYGL